MVAERNLAACFSILPDLSNQFFVPNFDWVSGGVMWGGGGSGKFSSASKSFETINISSIFHFYLTYFILLILFLLLLAQHASINFITTFCFNYTPLKLALNGIFQIKHQRYLY